VRTRVELEKAFREIELMNTALHEVECVGGSLHIITDDGNVKDSDILYCYGDVHSDFSFVGVLSRGILHWLSLMTESQRIVWWLASLISDEGEDPISIAQRVVEGSVCRGRNGSYDDSVTSPDGKKILWEGLEQLRARKRG
jgi:hypothetical protein